MDFAGTARVRYSCNKSNTDLRSLRMVRRCLALTAAVAVAAAILFSSPSAWASNKLKSLPQGWPRALAIPRLHVRASVEAVRMDQPGDLRAPFRWGDVAWYSRGPRPGEPGRATIFGHLDSYCCPAVFYRLKSLHRGDVVKVAYRHGGWLTFKVDWRAEYWNNQVPSRFIYGNTRERGLVLMTCAGDFHNDGVGYDHK
ncbi:MAG: hypothetical protein DLM70_00915, partial [Chloroflexi bacterium]